MDSTLSNRTSLELIEMWQAGSQEAAQVLLARYEVRLIALVVSRLSSRFDGRIAPEDVVQSAMGSFFRVTKANTKTSIKRESNLTAWNILATFVRRKLARAIERETAIKRGGGWGRVSLDELAPSLSGSPSEFEADEVLEEVRSILGDEQIRLLDLLLDNTSQAEASEKLGVDERTIRRRIVTIREAVASKLDSQVESFSLSNEMLGANINLPNINLPNINLPNINLPNISYRTFVLGKLLGSGALGKVYLAHMQADGKPIAVKFMHRHLWSSPKSRSSLLNEIDQASKINHPGVIKYLGWGQSPHGGPYLVCEYVAGRSLASLRHRDANSALNWLVQICDALSASHQAGIIHGDLTPNNILLDDQGRVVVIDFGFASHHQYVANSSSSLGHTNDANEAIGGTLGFAAPEQISSAFGTISYRTDIYAIGGLAYFLLSGKSPHSTYSIFDTVSAADAVVPTSVTTPTELKLLAVAEHALRKSVNCRPNSVDELKRLLVK